MSTNDSDNAFHQQSEDQLAHASPADQRASQLQPQPLARPITPDLTFPSTGLRNAPAPRSAARDISPEQLANLRGHAEQGNQAGVNQYLDCGSVLTLLAARDERDALQAKLATSEKDLADARAVHQRIVGQVAGAVFPSNK